MAALEELVKQMMGIGGASDDLVGSLRSQCQQGNTEACRQLAALVQQQQQMQLMLADRATEEERRRRAIEQNPLTRPLRGGA